jgi:leucyl aminopeptidase
MQRSLITRIKKEENFMEITIRQGSTAQTSSESIVLGIYEGERTFEGEARELDNATAGMLQEIMKAGDFKGELYRSFLLFKPRGIAARRIVLVGLGKQSRCTLDKIQGAAAQGARFVRDLGVPEFAIPAAFARLPGVPRAAITQALAEGIMLGLYSFDAFKTGNAGNRKKNIRAVTVLVENARMIHDARSAVRKAEIISRAVHAARDMVSRPANSATPKFMAHAAKTTAKKTGLSCTVLGPSQAKKLGMGCFMGVARGSREPAQFIVMEHVPAKARRGDTIVLVGKAITFDSGGISIKPAKGMERMKDDMSGGAAVLGIMQAAAQLNIPLRVIGIVPATENLPDGAALKPGDILTSLSGKTVEIITTDAEGRLILADALAYAQRYNPTAIIDLATLTGACITALGNEVAGVMGTDDNLINKIEEAAAATSEKVWQLPLWEEYGELLKSDVADMKNAAGRDAGAITGGCFLKEFAGKTPWAHLDIAGPVWTDKDRPYVPKGGTGFGVRLILHLLEHWEKSSVKRGK